MINELIRLADMLDRQGSSECADTLDSIIERYAKDIVDIKAKKAAKDQARVEQSKS